jgi:hypothetical protein
MTAIVIVIVATVVALAILAAATLMVARERRRRRHLRDEERYTTERVIWQRLDWVAPPVLSISEPAGLQPDDSAETAPLGEFSAVAATAPAWLEVAAVPAQLTSTEPSIPEPASLTPASLEPAGPPATSRAMRAATAVWEDLLAASVLVRPAPWGTFPPRSAHISSARFIHGSNS